ncbi:hypothetical protein [Sorangium sp. So ce1000]|uniref:hypothetical protein n=1 Tax=Sorangium sp. So ce1000 TaxID=3133325 RepID=UPI003F608DED
MAIDLQTAIRQAREMEDASVYGRVRRELGRSSMVANALAACALPAALVRRLEAEALATRPMLPALPPTTAMSGAMSAPSAFRALARRIGDTLIY